MSDPSLSLDRSLHAIADPTRRRILHALKERGASSIEKGSTGRGATTGHATGTGPGKNAGLCAGDVEERVRLSQPTISHHMAILTKAGLVHTAKHAQWRWYRRNEPAIRQLIKSLRAKL
jgi:DNA-binding transcriptional ArsR family regulator